MGAIGQDSIVYNTTSQYIQTPTIDEKVRIWRSSVNDHYYGRRHDGTDELIGCCGYIDSMRARLLFNDELINFSPKTPIYDALGVIDNNYFGDLLYAETLANTQAFKGYNNNSYNGAFTVANLNNVNGKITIPSNGYYGVIARLAVSIIPIGDTGTNSITSANPPTNGLKWNSDKSVKPRCLFQIGVYDYQRGEIGCCAYKELTDCGNFQIDCSMVRRYDAGEKVRGLFINNTDMDVYGLSRIGSEFELFIAKIAD